MADLREPDAVSTLGGETAPTTTLARTKKPGGVVRMLGVGAGAAAVITLAVFGSNKLQKAALERRDRTPAIAVLPFENVGRKEGQEFADGMTEEITNRLASLRGLRVIGRHSAQSYAGSVKTPREIANELGVKYVLKGTVRWDKAPDGKDLVRVSPSLLRSEDATQMWTEAYQTGLSGMFEVQSKVATEVANALKLTLLAPERAALDAKPTRNRGAYNRYVRARYILDNSFEVGPVRDAIALLEKSVAADPRFVLGWAYLAIAHTDLYALGGDPTEARLKRARAALDKALDVNSDVADVHLAHGIYLYRGLRRYDDALREFEVARALRPSDPSVPLYVAAISSRQGNWAEAVENYKRAVNLDPRSAGNLLDLATTLEYLNRYPDAEKYLDQAMMIAPAEADGPRQKALIAINARGNVPEAIEHMRNAVRTVQPRSSLINLLLSNPWPAAEDPILRKLLIESRYSPDMGKGWFYAKKADLMLYLGDVTRAHAYADSAVAALNKEVRNVPEPSGIYLNLAVAHSIRGNRREALDALARAEQELPQSMDAFAAADRENGRIMILTLLGDYDAAISQMERRVNVQGGVSRNYLRLNPRFAAMRAIPAFQRVIGEP